MNETRKKDKTKGMHKYYLMWFIALLTCVSAEEKSNLNQPESSIPLSGDSLRGVWTTRCYEMDRAGVNCSKGCWKVKITFDVGFVDFNLIFFWVGEYVSILHFPCQNIIPPWHCPGPFMFSTLEFVASNQIKTGMLPEMTCTPQTRPLASDSLPFVLSRLSPAPPFDLPIGVLKNGFSLETIVIFSILLVMFLIVLFFSCYRSFLTFASSSP